jgi:hypothetical protein
VCLAACFCTGAAPAWQQVVADRCPVHAMARTPGPQDCVPLQDNGRVCQQEQASAAGSHSGLAAVSQHCRVQGPVGQPQQPHGSGYGTGVQLCCPCSSLLLHWHDVWVRACCCGPSCIPATPRLICPQSVTCVITLRVCCTRQSEPRLPAPSARLARLAGSTLDMVVQQLWSTKWHGNHSL